MISPFTHDALAGRVVFGVGRVAEVAQEVDRLGGDRVLLIGGGGAHRAAGDGIAEGLGPRLAARHLEVRQHVPEAVAAAAVATAERVGADTVVTLGGGSATGLGKAVAVELDLVLLAVPTTYAGSEMTPIHATTGRHKRTGRDLRALPRTVIYDPALTVGLPRAVTAATGMNAIAHCIQALSAPDSDPAVTLGAEAGLAALAAALPRAVERPDDLDARADALWGASMAGRSLAAAGTGLQHRLAHILGGTFGLVHGDVHAVLLPHLTGWHNPAGPDAMVAAGRALGVDRQHVPAATFDLATRLGTPTSLVALGITEDDLEVVADLALDGDAANPWPLDRDSLLALLRAAWAGRRPSEAWDARPTSPTT